MIAVARVPVRFPVAEGIGIFIGVAAWELLTVGELKLLEALLAGTAGALVWYGVRSLRSGARGASSDQHLTRPTDGPERDQ